MPNVETQNTETKAEKLFFSGIQTKSMEYQAQQIAYHSRVERETATRIYWFFDGSSIEFSDENPDLKHIKLGSKPFPQVQA